jgi:hypothetical protein
MGNAVRASDRKARGRGRHETKGSTAERERLTCAQRFVQACFSDELADHQPGYRQSSRRNPTDNSADKINLRACCESANRMIMFYGGPVQ